MSGLAIPLVEKVLDFGSHAGGSSISRGYDQLSNKAYPNQPPGPAEILFAWRTGYMSASMRDWLLSLHGIVIEPQENPDLNLFTNGKEALGAAWDRVVDSQTPRPSIGEIMLLCNRGFITEKEALATIQRHGFSDEDVRMNLLSLRNEVPGAADLVRFAVRHVFEPDLVAHFGYQDEYRPVLDIFHQQQGLNYKILTGPLAFGQKNFSPELQDAAQKVLADYAKFGVSEPTWAQCFWWSHWILPSPSQGYEMVQRLRPTGGIAGGPRDGSGEVFTNADLSLLLRANDYPPYWRDKLAAISYRVPGLRQLGQLYKFGLSDRADLIERYQDIGYRPDNAALLADLQIKGELSRRYKAEITGAKGKVVDAYRVGTMSREDAASNLYLVTREDPDAAQVFLALGPEQQSATALGDQGVNVALQMVDVQIRNEQAKELVAATKRLFLRGRISEQDAQARLMNLGIVDERRQDYLSLWSAQLDVTRKELAAGKIQALYRVGILSEYAAKQRLSNLGYGDEDAGLLLVETKRNIALDIAKAQLASARSSEAAEKAAKAAAKAAEAERQRAVKRLLALGTPAKLTTWFVAGYITEDQFRGRLSSLGFVQDDIDREIAEAKAKVEKQNAKAQTASGPAANGEATGGEPPVSPADSGGGAV